MALQPSKWSSDPQKSSSNSNSVRSEVQLLTRAVSSLLFDVILNQICTFLKSLSSTFLRSSWRVWSAKPDSPHRTTIIGHGCCEGCMSVIDLGLLGSAVGRTRNIQALGPICPILRGPFNSRDGC